MSSQRHAINTGKRQGFPFEVVNKCNIQWH